MKVVHVDDWAERGGSANPPGGKDTRGAQPDDEPTARPPEADGQPPAVRKQSTVDNELADEAEEVGRREEAETEAFSRALEKITQHVRERRTALKEQFRHAKLDPKRDRGEVITLAEAEAADLAKEFKTEERYVVVKRLLRQVAVPGDTTDQDKFATMVLIGFLGLDFWSQENFLYRVQRKVGNKMMEKMQAAYEAEYDELAKRLQVEAPGLVEEEQRKK